MELKTKYQYTYFIYPFIIKENKYQKYLSKIIKDKRFELKNFKKEKDLHLYEYFLPKVGNFLFSGFDLTDSKISKLKELPEDTKVAVLSKYSSIMFDYKIENDIQGKTEEDKGIFFKIQKVRLICFNTGICFLCLKTNVENSEDFLDVLNFNYKFRDINKESNNVNKFDNIYLQTNTFDDVDKFMDFVKEITGPNFEMEKVDIDDKKFLAYSYVCVDQQAWNEVKKFEDIEYNFVKFLNFLPADNIQNLTEESISYSKWKYAKLGISRQGVGLFASSVDINNYTLLPTQFENEYFYTYILNLYKRIYLKKLESEFTEGSNLKNVRKKFIEFTKKIWIQEVTDDEIGANINFKFSKIFELDRLYLELKNKYDILYKQLNVEKSTKYFIAVIILLALLLVFNVLNYIEMIK